MDCMSMGSLKRLHFHFLGRGFPLANPEKPHPHGRCCKGGVFQGPRAAGNACFFTLGFAASERIHSK